jgi:hypothetical protein
LNTLMGWQCEKMVHTIGPLIIMLTPFHLCLQTSGPG